jgi:hypothetical protein
VFAVFGQTLDAHDFCTIADKHVLGDLRQSSGDALHHGVTVQGKKGSFAIDRMTAAEKVKCVLQINWDLMNGSCSQKLKHTSLTLKHANCWVTARKSILQLSKKTIFSQYISIKQNTLSTFAGRWLV